MSYNGSGTFQINTSGQPVVTGTSISSTVFNALTADLATGLSTAITKDGQTTTTARIPFALGINSTLVTDATNTTSGSIITAGGVGIAKALYVGTTANVAGAVTLGGVATFSAQPIFSSLTASSAVATDASKGLVSVTNTGTGNNVLATAPTIASLNLTTALTIASAAGTAGQALTSGGAGAAPTWSTIAATPGGSTTQVQYNNAGAFAGSANLTFNGSALAVTGSISSTGGFTSNTTITAQLDGSDSAGAGPGFNLFNTAFSRGWRTQLSASNNKVDYYFNGAAYVQMTTLNTNGALALSGASTSATGVGITFPATQSASSDANTLDDYEEGTWTPSLGGNTTYNTQSGQYTKIGRQVTVTASLIVTTLGTGSTTTISGLPFSTNATFISGNAVAKFSNLAVNVIGLNALALDGSVTTIRFAYISASGGANTYDPALFGNNTNVFFTLTYFVN